MTGRRAQVGAPQAARVVPMTDGHVDALMAYEQELFGPEAWSAQAYRDELADTRTRRYLAAVDEQGALLGWAGVRVVGAEAEILTVGVIPPARRRGIAGQLVAGLLAQARTSGAAQAFLEVRVDNLAARALYERHGFVRVGVRRGYYENGRVDALVMRRDV